MLHRVALGSKVNADEHRGYLALDGVNMCVARTHANGVESFLALVKRAYIGVHRHQGTLTPAPIA